MKKWIYLITHGNRHSGPDPRHTAEGLKQIRSLQIPSNIKYVIVGTGTRFQEIYEALYPVLPGQAKIIHSIFCGSSDGIEPDGKGILDNGRKVDLETEYIGLMNPQYFDAWKFVNSFDGDTLLCAGGELMISLGLKAINEKGHLYELDPEDHTGRMIQ